MSPENKNEVMPSESPKCDVAVTIDGKKAFFKKPNRATLGLAMAKGANDPLTSVEIIVENCYVGGDISKKELLEDVSNLFALSGVVNQIIGTKAVEVKNS